MRRWFSAWLLVGFSIGMIPICDGKEWNQVPGTPGSSPGRSRALAEGMPEPIKPITSVGTNTAPQDGRLPMDYAMSALPAERVAPPAHVSEGDWTGVRWEAPGTCHRPLYFEDPSLERHGYSLGVAQPFASAAHFVGNTAILPYRMVAEPTCDCVYTLGHERPGTPTPRRYYRPPFSVGGGVAQAGVVTGLIFLLP